jgi:hypothetical protein
MTAEIGYIPVARLSGGRNIRRNSPRPPLADLFFAITSPRDPFTP